MTKAELKLQTLAEIEGFDDSDAMIEANHIDSVVPGICTADGCDYSTSVEPDARGGWCENCDKPTVRSCLVLAGIV